MNETAKIVGINLGILLVYSVLIYVLIPPEDGFSLMALMVYLVRVLGIHVLVNLIIAAVFFWKKQKPRGKSFLLASVAVLVIGLASCFVGVWLI